VPFKRQQHSLAFTAQEVAASEHLPDVMVAKLVMVFADADMVMLVLPASHHADLTKVVRYCWQTPGREVWRTKPSKNMFLLLVVASSAGNNEQQKRNSTGPPPRSPG
jgi:hypothetical protein